MLTKVSENKLEKTGRIESQYTRSLIEASLDPLVTISAKGKITDMNEALANITGLTREKLTGTDFLDYFTEPQKGKGSLPGGVRKGISCRFSTYVAT
jgi:PAS domain-containing protein